MKNEAFCMIISVLLILLITQSAIAFVSSKPVIEEGQGGGQGEGQGGGMEMRREGRDLEIYYTIQTALSFANILLSTILLGIYLETYSRIRSQVSLSLVLVSLVFLFYSLTSNPLLHSFLGFQGFGLGPFAMLPELFGCIALAILVYISLR